MKDEIRPKDQCTRRPASHLLARVIPLCVVLGFLILHPSSFILSAGAQPPLFEPQDGYYKAKGTRVIVSLPADRVLGIRPGGGD